MQSHLFPVKLVGLVNSLTASGVLLRRVAPDAITQSPDDGCNRYVLFADELNEVAASVLPDVYRTQIRKRLALPVDLSAHSVAGGAKLELYDIYGTLKYSCNLTELPSLLSMAVEVELMSLLLSVGEYSIPME